MTTLQYGKLINVADDVDIDRVLSDTPFFMPLETWEHRTGIYLFDSLMMAAREHSALYIDFQGDFAILDSIIRETGEIDVIGELAGNSDVERLIFRTRQAPSGRWRVDRVIFPGGDEEQAPWSLPGVQAEE